MSHAAGPVDALGLVGQTVDQVRFDACVDGGGFGLIYRGHHHGLGETVAVKCLRVASIQRTSEKMRDALAGRFRDETKLLYRLSQGNLDIVRCIGSGTVLAPKTGETTPYMILEWLEGETLGADLGGRRVRSEGPRTLDEAVALLDPAAIAIAYAHSHDVVHRDIKPGNLFLTRTREGVRLKVLDFGLAKILSDETIGVRASVETGVGVHFCSPSYGAPEQFSPRAGRIGPATDVYSLALVVLEVLRGEKVRPASSLADGLLKALAPATGSPSASSLGLRLPREVEDVLLRAVAQTPDARQRDVGVFWNELKAALARARVMRDDIPTRDNKTASMPPAPFFGTLMMGSAPQGAPHLAKATSSVPPSPAGDVLARGGVPRPVTLPLGQKSPKFDQDAATLPAGTTSPLASSMAPSHGKRSLPPGAQASPFPERSAPPELHGSQRPPMRASLPSHGSQVTEMSRSASGRGTTVVFVLVCIALVVASATFALVRVLHR